MNRRDQRILDADIASLLIDFARGTSPQRPLGRARRQQLVAYLDTVVVDPESVMAHLRYVRKALKGQKTPVCELSEVITEKFLEQGADALSDEQLVSVLLDPLAMMGLHDDVDERVPPHFEDAMVASARAYLADLGVEPVRPWLPAAPELELAGAPELASTRGMDAAEAAQGQKKWLVRGHHVRWRKGSEALLGKDGIPSTATVTADWDAKERCLVVRLAGFLAPGKGSAASVVVLDAQGVVLAEAGSKTLSMLKLSTSTSRADVHCIRVEHVRGGFWDIVAILPY
ncbi:MAG: hypothetical protein JNK49_02050 [Planctomycetes bacterium]|nr:hypothetical protein [Planctomycetota bacterium]